MKKPDATHYATLGLRRSAGAEEIRAAYFVLARNHHPDRNAGSSEAHEQTLAINAAYEVLGDPGRKREYDDGLGALEKVSAPNRARGAAANLAKEIHLGIAELFSGTTLNVAITDPANTSLAENYELAVPPETAPGARFRLRRDAGGTVTVRIKLRPDARFKPRGSDLRCDLKISTQCAANGGSESVRGPAGNYVRVEIPHNVPPGEILRIPGEGLPRPRGGRGDLLVRILHRPEIRITRSRG